MMLSANNAEPTQTLHAILTFVPAAVETVSPLGHADAPFASGTPFLAVAEPALLCSRLRSALLVERLGTQTRLTPFAFGSCFIFAE